MLKPFKILSEEKVYEAPNKMFFVESDVETSEDKKVRWGTVVSKEGVAVLAMDEKKDVYIKQEWRLNRKDFVWEVASGWVDVANPTEADIGAAAQRELQEEIGFKAGSMDKLMSFYPMNHVRGQFHLYLATSLEPSKLAYDDDEILEVQKFPFDVAYDMVVRQQVPTAQNALIFELVRQRIQSTES